MITRAITLATLASMTCVHAITAQQSPDMVPLEFVELLSMMPMPGERGVAVGRLPDRLAGALAEVRDARIVGSLISPEFSLSAMVVQGRPSDVRERLVTRLVEQGWTELPVPSARGGFETDVSERGPRTLCSPDDYNTQLIVSRHTRDSTVVRLVLGSGDIGAPCAGPEMMSQGLVYDEVPLPQLHAPVGAIYRGGGSRGGVSDGSAEGRLRTDMEPSALLKHYAAQMIDAGWQPGVQTTSPDAALQAFSRTDDSRVDWHAVLYVIALPDRERDLYLRVTREQ